MISLDQFIAKYNGKAVDFDGAYGAQCVDLYRYYLKEVLGIAQTPPIPGAKDIWDNYGSDLIRIENTPDGVPPKGAIMIWGAKYGTYGHVAIVTDANVNNFTAFSQNDPIGSKCFVKYYSSYKGVLGWLVTKDNNDTTKQELEACRTDRDTHWNRITATNEALELPHDAPTETTLKSIAGLKGRITELQTKIPALEQEVANRVEQISRQDALLTEKNVRIQQLQNRVVELEGLYDGEAKAKGKALNDLASCRANQGKPKRFIAGIIWLLTQLRK